MNQIQKNRRALILCLLAVICAVLYFIKQHERNIEQPSDASIPNIQSDEKGLRANAKRVRIQDLPEKLEDPFDVNNRNMYEVITDEKEKSLVAGNPFLHINSPNQRVIDCMAGPKEFIKDKPAKNENGKEDPEAAGWSNPGQYYKFGNVYSDGRFVRIDESGYEMFCENIFDRKKCRFSYNGHVIENPQDSNLLGIISTDGAPDTNYGCSNDVRIIYCEDECRTIVEMEDDVAGLYARWIDKDKIRINLYDQKLHKYDNQGLATIECACTHESCDCARIVSKNEYLRSELEKKNIKIGMTWGISQKSDQHMQLSCSAYKYAKPTFPFGGDGCNSYHGDTPCTERLPLLCLNTNTTPVKPEDLAIGAMDISRDAIEVNIVENVLGTDMTSLETANAICEKNLGKGWIMANGGKRYAFWAKSNFTTEQRFWVITHDGPKCW